jgi:hypothetical protein
VVGDDEVAADVMSAHEEEAHTQDANANAEESKESGSSK